METNEGTPVETVAADLPGVFATIGALPAGAIVTEDALAKLFDRHPASIKRAVARGELPAPARLLGGNAWTAGAIVRHVERRMEAAAKELESTARRVEALRP
ncbi:MAG: hypothetical protein NTW87_06325 [Planctomycetota bacterium]|nr:hypothetical protein [Planctomycetota bacterium]